MDTPGALESNDILDWLMMADLDKEIELDLPTDKIMNLLSSTDHTLTSDDQAFIREQLITTSQMFNATGAPISGTSKSMRVDSEYSTGFDLGGSSESEKEEGSEEKGKGKKRKMTDVADPTVLKKMRQEKNRYMRRESEKMHQEESARESRKRKKELLDSLEAKIKELKDENVALRKQMNVGVDVEKEDKEKWEITRNIEKLVESGATDSKIASVIKHFGDKYADYGETRWGKVEHHLKQIHKLLIPTETTKMAIWTLHQDDDFYKDDTDPLAGLTGGSTIWSMLASALDATADQKKALLDARSGFKTIWALLQKSVSLVSELKSSIQAKNDALAHEMDVLQTILTPKQTAQFILWVTKNPVAMQMLNRVLAKSKDSAAI